MSAALDREALLDAFDSIRRAAANAGTKLQIAVYGGNMDLEGGADAPKYPR